MLAVAGAAMLLAISGAAAATAASGAPRTAAPASRAADTAISTAAVRQREWWLAKLGVSTAWSTSRGAGVTVAVLSDGVDAAQPDISGSVVAGIDYAPAQVPSRDASLGTAIASLIAGHGHGPGHQLGIIGIAPDARILSVPVTLPATDALLSRQSVAAKLPSAIAAGIRYAVRHGAQVIDLPIDPGQPGLNGLAGVTAAAGGSTAEHAAVSSALAKGVVLVAPAGDDGASTDAVNYPAAYPGVIAVGAFDQNLLKAPYTSHRSYVTLTAAGTGVVADAPVGYQTLSSTSAASAIVTGIAALIKSRYPSLSPVQVRQALIAGARFRRPGGTLDGSGYGTADAARSLTAAAPMSTAIRSRTAGAGAMPFTRPSAPAASPASTTLLERLLTDVIISVGVLLVLLVGVFGYAAHRARRARRAVGHRGAERSAPSRYRYSVNSAADRVLEYLSPATAPADQSAPRATAAPLPATGVGFEPPPRRPKVSGAPPWEPAPKPDGELPWALPSAGGGGLTARTTGASSAAARTGGLPPWTVTAVQRTADLPKDSAGRRAYDRPGPTRPDSAR